MVDELATLNMADTHVRDELLPDIGRLGRELNMWLVVTAQKPTVEVVGSQLRPQLGVRILGRTESNKEGSWILNRPDANTHLLPGKGVMVSVIGGSNLLRGQIAFIRSSQVEQETDVEWSSTEVAETAQAQSKSPAQIDAEAVHEVILEALDDSGRLVHGGLAKVAEALGVTYKGPKNRNRVKRAISYVQQQEFNGTTDDS